jgi:hypothetical protein
VWDGYNYGDWDGTHNYKRLEAESGIHKVLREANGPGVVIGNDHKDDKSGAISYQVRTGEQFAFEQPVIRKFVAEQQAAVGVRGHVTVGRLRAIE